LEVNDNEINVNKKTVAILAFLSGRANSLPAG
jgi:hypothetical protein